MLYLFTCLYILLSSLINFTTINLLKNKFYKKTYSISNKIIISNIKHTFYSGYIIFPILIFTSAFGLGCGLITGNIIKFPYIKSLGAEACFLISSLVIIYCAGIYEDIYKIRSDRKFFVQILTAILIIFSDIVTNELHGIFGISLLPPVLIILITLTFAFLVMKVFEFSNWLNKINLTYLFCLYLFFCIYFALVELHAYLILSASMIGIIIPLVYFNRQNTKSNLIVGRAGSGVFSVITIYLSITFCSNNQTNDIIENIWKPLIIIFLIFIPLLVIIINQYKFDQKLSPCGDKSTNVC